jgi:hypothetical protein
MDTGVLGRAVQFFEESREVKASKEHAVKRSSSAA